MIRVQPKKLETRILMLEAAKKVLSQSGYAGLFTRAVAAAAGVALSQIHIASSPSRVDSGAVQLSECPVLRPPERHVQRHDA